MPDDKWDSRGGGGGGKNYSCNWISITMARINPHIQVSLQKVTNHWENSIHRGAAKVLTLEYGNFKSEHPKHEFVRPKEFHERYQAGTLDKFDAIFTYSSVEHSGLGRKSIIITSFYYFPYPYNSYLVAPSQGLQIWGAHIVAYNVV